MNTSPQLALFKASALVLLLLAAAATTSMAQNSTWNAPASISQNLTWTSAGGNYTSNGTLVVGDAVLAKSNSANLTNNRVYYVVAVNGANYTLSATPGGSAILGGTGNSTTVNTLGVLTWGATGATTTQSAASWNGTVPNSIDAIANFGNSIANPVAVSSNVTVGTINFTSTVNELNLLSSNNGTTTARAALTFSTSSGTPTINVTGTKLFRLGLNDATFANGQLKINGTQGLVLNVTNSAGGGSVRIEDVDFSGFTNGSGGAGNVTIQQGIVQTTVGNVFGNNSTNTMSLVIGTSSTNGSLYLPELQIGNSQNIQINNLDGNSFGRITGASRTLTIGAGNGNNTDFAGTFGANSAGLVSSTSLVKSGSGTQTFSGAVVGAGNVTVGNGTMVFNGNNSYGGSTVINAGGTLKMGSSTALGLSGANVTVSITTNSSSANATVTSAAGLAIGQTISATGISAGTYITGISGTTLTLSANPTANGTVSGNFISGSTTVNSGGTLDFNGQSSLEIVSVSGNGTGGAGALVNSNASTAAFLNSEITNGVSFSVGGAGDLTLQRVRSGGGPFVLTKVGAGALTLGNANATSHNNLLGVDVTSASTVNLGMTGSNIAVDRGLRIGSNGTVTYTGNSTNMLSDTSEAQVNYGNLNMNGKSDTIGKLVIGNGTVAGNILGGASSVITVSGNYNQFGTNTSGGNGSIEAMSGTVDVVLAGTNPFNKTTGGVVTLSQANLYTGATTVSAGTLLVNGSTSASSAVTVNSGATLGGNGTIGGNTVVNGTLAPGNSPGLLTFTGSLTLNGTTAMQVTGLTRGSLYDAVDVGTSLVYGGALTIDFSSTFSAGDTFNLFDFASQSGDWASITFTGSYAGTLSGSAGIWTGNIGGQDFQYLNSTGVLSVVPEPATWFLLAGGLTALVVFRRRRID